MTIEYFFGALIIACVSAHLVWRNNFKVRRANAADKLRTAFAPALSALSLNIDHANIRAFFSEESILAQASAIEEFRPYARHTIPFIGSGISYQEAWNEYKKTIREENSAGIDPEATWLINQTMEDGEIVWFIPLINSTLSDSFTSHLRPPSV